MTNILTAQEGANFVRTDPSDAVMLMLLPQIDEFLKRATGRNWAADNTINPIAKTAAGILLVQWYDDPGQIDPGRDATPPFGLMNVLGQLEGEALKYRKYTFRGISVPGYIGIPGARAGDKVISLIGTYGVSGDQSASFETSVRYDDTLLQISTDNLYWNFYAVILKNDAEDVLP